MDADFVDTNIASIEARKTLRTKDLTLRSLEKVARLSELSLHNVVKIKSGANNNPAIATLTKTADAIDVKVERLLYFLMQKIATQKNVRTQRTYRSRNTILIGAIFSSVDLIVTSPPYNVGVRYNSHKDDASYEEYLKFAKKWLKKCYNLARAGGRFCLNIPLDKNKGGRQAICADITNLARKAGWSYHSTIIWNEGTFHAGPLGGLGCPLPHLMLSLLLK